MAVKRFFPLGGNRDALEALEREVLILTALRHPNIVQCLGSVLQEGERPCIVLELMEGGSLHEATHNAGDGIPETTRLSLLLQLARALVFLHTRTPLIVHRDVKPLNVLLDRARELCKLTDFGISRGAQTLLPKVRWLVAHMLCVCVCMYVNGRHYSQCSLLQIIRPPQWALALRGTWPPSQCDQSRTRFRAATC